MTQRSRGSLFHGLIGWGSETFASGAKLDSIRLLLGVQNGL